MASVQVFKSVFGAPAGIGGALRGGTVDFEDGDDPDDEAFFALEPDEALMLGFILLFAFAASTALYFIVVRRGAKVADRERSRSRRSARRGRSRRETFSTLRTESDEDVDGEFDFEAAPRAQSRSRKSERSVNGSRAIAPPPTVETFLD